MAENESLAVRERVTRKPFVITFPLDGASRSDRLDLAKALYFFADGFIEQLREAVEDGVPMRHTLTTQVNGIPLKVRIDYPADEEMGNR